MGKTSTANASGEGELGVVDIVGRVVVADSGDVFGVTDAERVEFDGTVDTGEVPRGDVVAETDEEVALVVIDVVVEVAESGAQPATRSKAPAATAVRRMVIPRLRHVRSDD